MSTLVTVLHVIVCLFLMLTVLLQSGKGGGMGAAFGGGNAATVFGGSGASGFLKRLTAIAGTIFMITSMVLAFLSSQNSADALESFGRDQEKVAITKEKAKEEALRAAKKAKDAAGSGSAGSGSAVGSGSASMSPVTPGSAGSAVVPPTSGSGAAEAEKPDAPTPPPPPTTPKTNISGSGNDPTGSAAPYDSSPNSPKP